MSRNPSEAAHDSFLSYEQAIREIRLRRIRLGQYQPRQTDPEEMAKFTEWQREREERA